MRRNKRAAGVVLGGLLVGLVTGSPELAAQPDANGWLTLDTGVPDFLYGMTFLDRRSGYAVAWGTSPGAMIMRTSNGGESWTQKMPVSQSLLFGIAFTDRLRGYAVGFDGMRQAGLVLRTEDGGETWTRKVLGGTFGLYDVDFPNEREVFVCGFNGRIFRTRNRGLTWRRMSTGTTTVTFVDLCFTRQTGGMEGMLERLRVSNPAGFALGGSRVYRSDDGGRNWAVARHLSGTWAALHFFDSQNGVVAGFRGGREAILRTSDGGSSWTRVLTGEPGVVLQTIDFRDGVGYAAGLGSSVYYSEDYGETWTSMPAPQDSVLTLEVVQDRSFFGGSNGRIYRRNGTP